MTKPSPIYEAVRGIMLSAWAAAVEDADPSRVHPDALERDIRDYLGDLATEGILPRVGIESVALAYATRGDARKVVTSKDADAFTSISALVTFDRAAVLIVTATRADLTADLAFTTGTWVPEPALNGATP